MSEQAQAIFDEAMKLPIGERESLVSRLMRANDEEPLTDAELAAHDEAWAPEIRRRIAELESGQVQTVPWSEVRVSVHALLSRAARRGGRRRGRACPSSSRCLAT